MLSCELIAILERNTNKVLINMCKSVLLGISLALLIVILPIVTVFAEVSIGVRQGDWIQYNVNVKGNPPGDHNIQWASMNVTNVQGTAITLDIQTLFNDGTLYPERITLNLATGILGDDFFIPKNLNVGDKFYDAYQGNITITSIKQQTVAGAQRSVVLGSTNYTSYVWDRETGTLVAATSIEPDYTMVTDTNSTNIWQPEEQNSQPTLSSVAIELIGVIVFVLVLVFVALIVWQKRKSK
jgi:hypothetical protein